MSPQTIRILVIDDDPTFLEECENQLMAAGFEVLLALSGSQCRTLIAAYGLALDLALVDLVMPDESGLEVIRSVRQIAPELRVIAITARATQTVEETARHFGALAVLRKPLTAEWVDVIERVLSGPAPNARTHGHA